MIPNRTFEGYSLDVRKELLSALADAYIGDIDAAFENLSSVPRLGPDVLSNPVFAPLRDDPRWKNLERKAGIWPNDPRDEIEFALGASD